jgi:hypothetical protein
MNRFTGRLGPHLARVPMRGTGFRPMHALQLLMLRHFHIEIFSTTRRELRLRKRCLRRLWRRNFVARVCAFSGTILLIEDEVIACN